MNETNSNVPEKSPQKFDDGLLDPDEYKDSPIRFTMALDGRREQIKIVEPELDIALPEDGRLMIHEGERCFFDLIFKFDQAADKPYRLLFRVKDAVRCANEDVEAFGKAPPADKQLRERYRKDLLNRGGLQAWIEMRGGKARLFVRYERAGR